MRTSASETLLMTKVSPTQGGDGKKPRPPWSTLSTRAAESRLPGWIPKRDRHEAGSSSGTTPKQRSVKRPFTKQQADGEETQPPGTVLSSRGADNQRPGWISERDWQDAGSSSGTRHSPVKRLGPGSRPAKTARMQRRTAAVTATVSGMPRRRRSQEDVPRRSQTVASLNVRDRQNADDDDATGGRSGVSMEADHVQILSSAFDEVMREASASVHMLISSCVAMNDSGQQSGNESSS
ncbi:uncharacterized protein LOC119432378 [Dermacentor silvarum]|uniref:uncharacterized protein LOC119432378 n=1 Tax=Dermacentor silvarum TaxID=543639 RepID=UPI002100775E|nr:uncharacterized protein LOC119432378 [Dermacentor silvarum]